MKKTIQYGTTVIEFDLTYSDRKTLGIKVFPDTHVEITAPLNTTENAVIEKVKSKANWIIKQKEFFLSFHPLTPPRKFISGETHLYLGKQYRLKIIESKEESVKLYSGYLVIRTTDKLNKKRIKHLLHNWYQQKATIHFHTLFEKWTLAMLPIIQKEITLSFKWMDTKWGMCNAHGKITLNTELIKAPKKCIEYVIAHEMCHLQYLNHSKSFYKLLTTYYPSWREAKSRLEHFMV